MFRRFIHWLFNQIKMARPLSLDHIGVCLTIALLGGLLYIVLGRIGIFDPVKAAFDDFHITDVYYGMIHSARPDNDKDIVIVDMAKLSTRDEIATAITDIKSCKPKVLCIDIIFERASFDSVNDTSLLRALRQGGCEQVLSCKLRDYDATDSLFRDCLYSFFKDSAGINVKWGYCNYGQIRMGGCTRNTTLFQKYDNSVVYSLPYTAACLYQGKKPEMREMNDCKIMYDDIAFDCIDTITYENIVKHWEKIEGKLVILGALDKEADVHFTPLGKMAGPMVLAYSAHTYLKGDTKEMGLVGRWIIAFVVCWLAACAGYRTEKRHPIVFSIVAKIINFVICAILVWVIFLAYARWGYYVNLLIPLAGLALAEDIREMYSAIVKWLQNKTHWKLFNKSLYGKGN